MTNKTTVIILGVVILVAVASYIFLDSSLKNKAPQIVDLTPKNVTLSGEYGCLPHLDMNAPHTMECAFGFKTDQGDYYAVNFGASATSAEQFQSGAHVTAEGFVVLKEALSTNQWNKYNMKGIFTITKVLDAPATAAPQGKINIDAVCRGALSYMTFADVASAEVFVTECKEGKHPDVIERYKAGLNVGDGAAI